MKRICLIGSANALKPKIMLETLLDMKLIPDKEIVLFTEDERGICADFCRNRGIKIVVFCNARLNDGNSIELARKQNIDLLVSAGWPYKIPVLFLNLSNFTPINCHGSVLPDYRGNRAYMHYWANCEEYYGATIHYMNERFDDGNVLVQGRLRLFLEETPNVLHRRTAELCAYLLPQAISLVERGYIGRKQEGLKRYFYKLSPKEFMEYRKFNETKEISERILTPHKILTDSREIRKI